MSSYQEDVNKTFVVPSVPILEIKDVKQRNPIQSSSQFLESQVATHPPTKSQATDFSIPEVVRLQPQLETSMKAASASYRSFPLEQAAPLPFSSSEQNEVVMNGDAGSDLSDSCESTSCNDSKESKDKKLHEVLYKLGSETVKVSYRKASYIEVLRKIDRDYQPTLPHQASSALDIIASYLKGQRTMYMEAMSLLKKRLNFLMLPAIIMSAVCSVLTQGTFEDEALGKYVLSGLNVMVACLIAIINFLKLDAAAEAHKTTAHRYDKILTSMEFTSGETLLVHDPALDRFSDSVLNKPEQYLLGFDDVSISDLSGTDLKMMARQRHYRNVRKAKTELTAKLEENIHQLGERISEIKDTNQFIIPKTIRSRYPLLQSINVFAIIKKIDDYKAHQITKLKNIKNEIRVITLAGTNARSPSNRDLASAKRRYLQNRKTAIINVILYLNTAFMMVERMFLQEMINAEVRQKHKTRFFLNNLLTSLLCCVDWNVCLPREFVSPEKAGGPILLKILGLKVEGDDEGLSKEAKELLTFLEGKNIRNIEGFNAWLTIENNKHMRKRRSHGGLSSCFSSSRKNHKVSFDNNNTIKREYAGTPVTPHRRKTSSRSSGQVCVNEQSSDHEDDVEIGGA
jgi:hypothetical protein